MDSIWQDLKFGWRRLWQSPLYLCAAAGTLALGIGATGAMFSMVLATLLRPLPYPDPATLVRVYESNAEKSVARTGIGSGNLAEWRRHNRAFEGIAGTYVTGRTLRLEQGAEVVRAAQVTQDFFPLLRTPALLGRTFSAEETERARYNSAAAPVGPDPVAVLSHRLWQSRFGGRADIVGQTISLERQPWEVIGVMPPRFALPDANVDLWLPWGTGDNPPRDQRYVFGLARLRAGVSAAQGEAELNAVATEMGRQFPETNKGWGVQLEPLHGAVLGESRAALLLLLGAVTLVLLIVCVNVAHLQLMRATERAREVAVRLALGATGRRLMQQFLTESLLVAALGGALGVWLAQAALWWLRWAGPADLPRFSEITLDATALGVTLAVTLLAGLATGLAPALGARRAGVAQALAEEGRGGSAGAGRQRWRNALVATQVAMAAALLVGAGLLVRSFARLTSVPPGFDAKNVLVLPIFLDNREYDRGAKVRAYYSQLLEKLTAVPGVISAGGATALPASPLGPDFDRPVWAEGQAPGVESPHRADVRMVTPDYFRTLGIPVKRGRVFGATDHPEAPRVILVNELLAQRIWPGEDAVGQRLVVDYSAAGTYPYEVVGITGNVRFHGLREEPRPEIFVPHAQRSYLIMNIAVKTAGDPRALVDEVRRAVMAVDPAQPAHSVRPLEDLVAATVARDRYATVLLAGFSATALLLAAMGIYAVMAFRVAQRTHEIGVRMALGAQPGDILRMVLRGALQISGAGIVAGLAAAGALSGLLSSLLFGVSPGDAASYSLAPLLLVAASVGACWFPARRAARVDPAVALRRM